MHSKFTERRSLALFGGVERGVRCKGSCNSRRGLRIFMGLDSHCRQFYRPVVDSFNESFNFACFRTGARFLVALHEYPVRTV